MGGGSGSGGADASQLQLWLKQYGRFSKFLCEELALFVEWILNETPSLAAIRALMAGQLFTLDKLPGLRLLGCRKTWRRLFSKCLLYVARSKAKLSCGTNQICGGGLRAGIKV